MNMRMNKILLILVAAALSALSQTLPQGVEKRADSRRDHRIRLRQWPTRPALSRSIEPEGDDQHDVSGRFAL